MEWQKKPCKVKKGKLRMYAQWLLIHEACHQTLPSRDLPERFIKRNSVSQLGDLWEVCS